LAQRLEMVRRIAAEIEGYLLELGEDGRLLALQLEELMAGVDIDRELITQDYLPLAWEDAGEHLQGMASLSSTDLFDLAAIAAVLGFPATEGLDSPVIPRGYRVLARIPRLPRHIADRLIDHFGNVAKLLAATSDDLQTVEGIGEGRARTIRDGLTRIADPGYPERYA
jgi:diadenylate cyclase